MASPRPVLALLMALTMLVGPVGLEGGLELAAKKKPKTVTRSFANGAPVLIPQFGEADPYPLAIDVGGFRKRSKITDVDVTLRDFSHEIPADVDMLLAAPNGANAIIFSDAGNAGVADLTLILDDDAASALPAGPLQSGAFRPANLEGGVDFFPDAPAPSGAVALSTFNGGKPNGQWRLFVVDNVEDLDGSLGAGYELTITVKVKKEKR